MTLRPPAGLWSLKGTWLVLAALLLPTVAVLGFAHDGDLAETMLPGGTVVMGCSALMSGVLLLGHAKLAGNDHSLRLGTSLGIFAVLALAGGGYGLTHPATLTVDRTLDTWLVPVLAAFMCGVLVLASVVHHLDTLPRWARDRLNAAVLLCALSALVLVVSVPAHEQVRAAVSLAIGVLGALLLATTSSALLRQVITDGQQQLTDLQRRLANAEAHCRADSARLHDINSLVAGIASASRLVRELPPSGHRAGLEVMIMAELDRLQRLLAERGRRDPGPAPAARGIDVDEVLGRIALSHQSRGRRVTRPATDVRLDGDADDLAQLLDILVENAAEHGSPDITLSVRRTGARVEIAVCDGGPGVPAELRESLFGWGVRAPDSDGSGIGLFTAKALAARLGGQLQLDDSAPGARFVLTLPGAELSTAPSPEDLAVAGR